MSFGAEKGDNLIMNKKTGEMIVMRQMEKGSFVIDVCFVGGVKTEITVDSGAEENVCPYGWGQEFGMRPAGRWMNFRSASGERIAHHGQRNVIVPASAF